MNLPAEEMERFARETLGLPGAAPLRISPLGGRGSDRSFFRLDCGEGFSAILIHYDPKRQENAYYADIGSFLHSAGIPVPRMHGHDREKCLMLMDDLGGEDLWASRNMPWSERRPLYLRTLKIVQRLHAIPEEGFPSASVPLMEGFGPDLYRWERNYFRDYFVSGVCGISLDSPSERLLEEELEALAERVLLSGHSLIHRDLQSQNVMLHRGEPFLIDFQGMRFGTPFYDLGSLLCDPYVTFSQTEVEELLAFYHSLTQGAWDWSSFRVHFWEASVQRLMQALGAYGFLGLNKGLTAFLHHIPAGIQNLGLAAARAESLPNLQGLTLQCAAALAAGRLR